MMIIKIFMLIYAYYLWLDGCRVSQSWLTGLNSTWKNWKSLCSYEYDDDGDGDDNDDDDDDNDDGDGGDDDDDILFLT